MPGSHVPNDHISDHISATISYYEQRNTIINCDGRMTTNSLAEFDALYDMLADIGPTLVHRLLIDECTNKRALV